MAPAKTAAKKRSAPRKMSAAHKKALADGRAMSAVVDRYLSVVNAPKPRGRRVSIASARKRLAAADARMKSATGVAKVLAAQEARDLRARLAQSPSAGSADQTKALEASFVRIAKRFSDNRNISYGAWRDAGVPSIILQKAGIARTRG